MKSGGKAGQPKRSPQQAVKARLVFLNLSNYDKEASQLGDSHPYPSQSSLIVESALEFLQHLHDEKGSEVHSCKHKLELGIELVVVVSGAECSEVIRQLHYRLQEITGAKYFCFKSFPASACASHYVEGAMLKQAHTGMAVLACKSSWVEALSGSKGKPHVHVVTLRHHAGGALHVLQVESVRNGSLSDWPKELHDVSCVQTDYDNSSEH